MKILQLCHRVPFNPTDGGNIAMMSLANSLLSENVEVKMLALNTRKHFVDVKKLPIGFVRQVNLEAVEIDTSVKPVVAFMNLFSNHSYNIIRFYSKEFETRLVDVLKKGFDIVQLESLFMAPYLNCIRKNSNAKIVLRAHNVEHVIWERLSNAEKNPLKKLYLGLLANRLKQYEIKMLNIYDAILPVTKEDSTFFSNAGCKLPMYVIPVGVDLKDYPVQINENVELSLFHLGSMDWMPNREGVQWFLEYCWGYIQNHFPNLKLSLAGRGFPKQLMETKITNVIYAGEIADANKYMQGKQIMIVPLNSGGGMRVKIVQGMALGKTIISTTIGAEGINYEDGKNILIANTPEEFLKQVSRCINDSSFCFSIGKAARTLAISNYSNEAIGKSIKVFYNKLV